MKHTLTDMLVDESGTSWDTVESWFFIGILEGCGCGNSNEIAAKAVEVLKFFDNKDRTESFWDKGESWEILAHWIDGKGLLEHGYTIGNSWLTEEGKEILKIIKEREALEAQYES